MQCVIINIGLYEYLDGQKSNVYIYILVLYAISYRQAQATVLEALPHLKKLNISTKRPQDYFAQMAKSDHQMQKVRSQE